MGRLLKIFIQAAKKLYHVFEKVLLYRLFKNVQMQGTRNYLQEQTPVPDRVGAKNFSPLQTPQ